MRIGLEALYGLIEWLPSSPSEPGARERLQQLRGLMSKLLPGLGLDKTALRLGSVNLLDLMAGGCVAGAAAAWVLAEKGARVRLMCVDARGVVEEAPQWLKILPEDIEERVEIEHRRGDVTRLPRLLERGSSWDIALLWGSPLPHLSPHELLLVLAGLRELQSSWGTVLIEQNNVGPKTLVGRNFREVMIEGRALLVYRGCDPVNGMAERLVYELPSLGYMGVDHVRLWDVADVAAQVAVFYREAAMQPIMDYARVWVVAGVGPRSSAPSWEELAETLRKLRGRAA